MKTKPTRVLVVDDEQDTVDWMQIFLEQQGFEVRTALDGRTSELLCRLWRPDIVLLDLVLPDIDGLVLLSTIKELVPGTQVVVVSGRATVSRAVEALTGGAFSLIEKPVVPEQLLAVLEKAHGAREGEPGQAEVNGELQSFCGMLSQCASMQRLFDLIRATAPTDANVLVIGENGTGKELVASAMHELSARREHPFIRINCAAIPSELLESELFGHRKGAFTGAALDKKGLLELAHRGSVLLDEIGEMPVQLQVKLLRVLQDREFRPVGGTASVKTDFRLICATNLDPVEAVRRGQLREDLYFRLNTITLPLPPLREREGDVPLLAQHFLKQFATQHNRDVRGFQQAALRMLERHSWPGNVRELQHVVERAVILATGPYITTSDLPDSVRGGRMRMTSGSNLPTGCTLEELERLAILQTLELTSWNKRATAKILGIHRPTLYNKLRKYRLWRRGDRFRHDSEQGAE